jgi:hypothetical protein
MGLSIRSQEQGGISIMSITPAGTGTKPERFSTIDRRQSIRPDRHRCYRAAQHPALPST